MKCAVLISLYNAEKTLDKTFESLAMQRFQNFRIVAIDDCSKDKTSDLLEEWQKKFGRDRFLVIRNETNIGLTRSLNKGLEYITEPYTARIDADDRWLPEKLEKQLVFLDSHPEYGIVGCNYINERSGKQIRVHTPETDEKIKVGMIRRNPFAHSCVVFRTEIIKNSGGYDKDIRYGQDYELWLRCSLETKYHNLQEFLCHRNAEGGISFEKQNEQMSQCIKTQIRYMKKLNRPIAEYRFLLEPFAVIITPAFIRELKRKFL